VEVLENSLSEAREKLSQSHSAKRISDAAAPNKSAEVEAATAASSEESRQLHNQLAAQAEVIENLEADLKRARMAENEARAKSSELERLADDIATKNTFIGTLQKDIDEHQKTAAQLRKRDIEVRALANQLDEQSKIVAALKAENEQLRAAKQGDVESLDRQKSEEKEIALKKMGARLKEYEGTIATLNEAVDRWKRKYDFLAADAPYGYDSATGK
jgi:chromosome segregation ATPase